MVLIYNLGRRTRKRAVMLVDEPGKEASVPLEWEARFYEIIQRNSEKYGIRRRKSIHFKKSLNTLRSRDRGCRFSYVLEYKAIFKMRMKKNKVLP